MGNSQASRFWAAISEELPESIPIKGLLESPNSLSALSKINPDGWGIGYYDKKGAMLLKGTLAAYQDEGYKDAVLKIAPLKPSIIVAHIRKAASGCSGTINPHPFERNKNGKDWFFGHNGSLDKEILMDLIGKGYLSKNPPDACTDNPPDSWVDSELYFIFLLKNIEESSWNVEAGIKNAINKLEPKITDKGSAFNFFLTDGEAIWFFSKGRSLYYYWDENSKSTVVASMYTTQNMGGWIEVPDNNILTAKKGVRPTLTDIVASVVSATKIGGD